MGTIIGWLGKVDWQATGVLAIAVWQAVKEWRTKAVVRPSPNPKPKPRPPATPR